MTALAMAGVAAHGAQIMGGSPTAQVLVSAQFRAPMTYEAALAKVEAFYQEQVNQKLDVAFPEIGPRQHYDVWHDMWVTFDGTGEPIVVTVKRPADSITSRLVKSWMLGLAGRLGAEIPLMYRELPALSTADADVYATPRDVAAILKAQTGLKPLRSWQHPGLMVSASPMASIVMEAAGLHGVHHLTATAETAAGARLLLAKVMQGAQKACICAAFSETAELDAEIAREAQQKSDTLGAHTAASIYTPKAGVKYQEERVRSDPEMQKRIAQAAGYYDVKYRIDKPYRQVTVWWSELQGYSREDGKFGSERPLGHSAIPAPRMPAQNGGLLNARVKLEPLRPGAYRVRLEGDLAGGKPAAIDERIYWFDGKRFEEL